MGGMFTLVGMVALVEEELEELKEVMQEWCRCKTWRYSSFSTFLFRVEFQWFLMELSVLRTEHRNCFRTVCVS